MSLSIVVLLISFAVTTASVAYALHQVSHQRKVRAYMRSEAWYLYAQSNHALSQFEKAIDLYKRRNANHVDPELIERLARSHAFGEDLIRETIRLLQLVEPKFDADTIRKWASENKFAAERDRALFETLSVSLDEPPVARHREPRTPTAGSLRSPVEGE